MHRVFLSHHLGREANKVGAEVRTVKDGAAHVWWWFVKVLADPISDPYVGPRV